MKGTITINSFCFTVKSLKQLIWNLIQMYYNGRSLIKKLLQMFGKSPPKEQTVWEQVGRWVKLPGVDLFMPSRP